METIGLAVAGLTSAVGGAGTLGTITTLLGAGLGIVSALNQSATMSAQAQLAQISAQSGMISAEFELVKGQQEAVRIREQMLKTLASQRARYAAAGVVLDGGTPATVAEETTREADRETEVVTTNAGMRAAQTRIVALNQAARAQMLEDQAQWTMLSGIGGSLLKGFTGLSGLASTLPGDAKLGDKLLA